MLSCPFMRLLRAALLALAALGAMAVTTASCLSPTLPLPPPSAPEAIQPSEDGTEWTVSGYCTVGATVTVLNEKTGRGVVVEDLDRTGHYVVVLAGTKCDLASVTEEVGDEESSDTTFVLAPRTSSDPVDSQDCH